jgi:Beta protein
MSGRSQRYIPALKAREAEIKALLKAPMSLDVTPLFELQQAPAASTDPATGLPRRSKGARTDAAYFLDDISRLWDGPIYVDIHRVANQANAARWWRLLDALEGLSTTPPRLIPVLTPSDPVEVLVAAADLAAAVGRAALRLTMSETQVSDVQDVFVRTARDVGVRKAGLDVVLDWADATETRAIENLVSQTQEVISALPGRHGEIATIGTPNSNAFQQEGDWRRPRLEWELWRKLAASNVDVTYGDYALYPPSDPVPVRPLYGHLRYSSGNELHVHRRAIPRTGGGVTAAFAECCKHLVAQSHWLGADFSKADQRLYNIASDGDKESTPGKWRQLAAEHHFALVASQLGT